MKYNFFYITKKEILEHLDNNWCLMIAVFIFILNLGILYSSKVFIPHNDEINIKALLLSIIHLQVYIIPLLSLILSYDIILKEKELGMMDLLLSYSLTTYNILFSKWVGVCVIFSISFLLGIFIPMFYLNMTGIGGLKIIEFLLLSIWLNMVFSYIGIIISVFSKNRTIAISVSIIIWAIFIFLYDAGFIIFVIIMNGEIMPDKFNLLLLLNPVEIFRLISIFIFIPEDIIDLFDISVNLLDTKYIIISIITWLLLPVIWMLKKI